MAHKERLRHRLERTRGRSIMSSAVAADHGVDGAAVQSNVTIDWSWGRLIFGQTFRDPYRLAKTLCAETPGKRDIAMYVRDPHVVISLAPQEIFLDPSHTYRLWLDWYRASRLRPKGFIVRFLNSIHDAEAVCNIYLKRHMVPPEPSFIWNHRTSRILTYLVAEEPATSQIIGVVGGVDHSAAFKDPENGSSLWALAVDPQSPFSGIGEALVRQLAEHYKTRGRAFMDLSVMHNNKQAISLYEKLGFKRVPVFALKYKNPINEPLYVGDELDAQLNPYATILTTEARRRGIAVEVLDQESGMFSLSFGGRTIVCRESLTELTSAIAMTRCDDKALTRRVLAKANLRVPEQTQASSPEHNNAFLKSHRAVVVKPARGEQGAGISVDVRTPASLAQAIERARRVSDKVLLEEFIQGLDLRIVVIDFKVVAAAIRRPATIIGNGKDTVKRLIEKTSRRRAAATGGESKIPLDAETERSLAEAGRTLDSILSQGQELAVRKTANLHTGGTIHDVTHRLSYPLCRAGIEAARALDIPVVGLDFIVPSVSGADYAVIEANERPGLANHEPQPTAERFIDLLFPQTAVA
ncbi:MAG: N-acetylglutaminylglutamine synthetase [Gammaproteobacteria bacterium]